MDNSTENLSDFMARKGFVITNGESRHDAPKPSYRFAAQIFNNKAVLVPFLTQAALSINETRLDYHVADAGRANVLRNFLDGLQRDGLVPGCGEHDGTFVVELPKDKSKRRFFRSEWAEECFRHVVGRVTSQFCNDRGLPYSISANVELSRRGESRIFTELDLVVQIRDRFYAFEVKSGPWVRIMQWAAREMAFVDKDGKFKVIVCTIFDNIPANIFEPQLLMTIGGIERRLARLYRSDFGDAPQIDGSPAATLETIAGHLVAKRCRSVTKAKNEIRSHFNKKDAAEVDSIFEKVCRLTRSQVDSTGHVVWGMLD